MEKLAKTLVAGIMISSAFVFTIGLMACGTIPKKKEPEITVVKKEPVIHLTPQEQKALCLGAVTEKDVPDYRTATQMDWEIYTNKLKAAFKVCEAVVANN